MSIGNAPWPIGVTMVGIHARTGREKIFAQSIAHVLNDETQRKYIQVLLFIGCVLNIPYSSRFFNLKFHDFKNLIKILCVNTIHYDYHSKNN